MFMDRISISHTELRLEQRANQGVTNKRILICYLVVDSAQVDVNSCLE